MSGSLPLWALLAAVAFPSLLPAAAPPLTNALLFVTQPQLPDERNDNSVSNVAVSVVSPLGNHLADPGHAARGGDLWILHPNGALRNLTRAAGLGLAGNQDGGGIAVRDPQVDWEARRVLFSMVVGAPAGPGDNTRFFWQLHELTNLTEILADTNAPPRIIRVPQQPTNYNNVMGCYGTDGRILFVCDRPRDGAAHLYPQLDEYTDIPSNSGLWSLDPASGDLFQLDHSPSGDFSPFVDSFGRVIFTRWDHLVQDRNATDDRMGRATNGTFDYFSESGTNYDLANRPVELFPEPRTYDSNQLAVLKVQGNAINSFFPWMIEEDGSGMEFLNHVGRHELLRQFRGSSFTNDPNLRQLFNLTAGLRLNTNYLDNFLQIREDPLDPGTYFGTDAPDFGTHGAGTLLAVRGPPGTNAEFMSIRNITPKGLGPNLYRDPCPTTGGGVVAAYSPGSQLDVNLGTPGNPRSRFDFRIVTLTNGGPSWVNERFLTPGIAGTVAYWNGARRVTQTNALWELQPVEVVPRRKPVRPVPPVDPVEARVFGEEGVALSDMRGWLRSNQLALLISRNVTRRDRADREQPFNLRIAGTTTQTLGTNVGKIYDLAYIQYLQADSLRGLTYGTRSPVAGRRVLAVPLHEPAAVGFNVPAPQGPPGSLRLAPDGSQAAFLPARRAMTHQVTDGAGSPVVRERYWLTYQPGEIRTCANCHGINTLDQAGQPKPTNPPQALRDLLRAWKQGTGYARVLSTVRTNQHARIDLSVPPNRLSLIEATADFASWTPVGTNVGTTNGVFSFEDLAGGNLPLRFYRVRLP